MRKTLAKATDLNGTSIRYGSLRHASFHILEGDVVGFHGLNYSGKELAARILTGDADCDYRKLTLLINGRRIRNSADAAKETAFITANTPPVSDWTVFEYVNWLSSYWFLTERRKEEMIKKTEEEFETLGRTVSGRTRMELLSELDQRIAMLLRAKNRGAKIIVLEDECRGLNAAEIVRYAHILRNLTAEGMAIVFMSHSMRAMDRLCNEYVVFDQGCVIKKWSKDNSPYTRGEQLLFLERFRKNTDALEEPVRKNPEEEKVQYQIRDLRVKRKKRSFAFRRGEISTFIILETAERERFFLAVSGREADEEAAYRIGNTWKKHPDVFCFFRERIVSLTADHSYETADELSVVDNLMLPSFGKIPPHEYMLHRENLEQLYLSEIEEGAVWEKSAMGAHELYEHILISLQRWYLFRPKVLVLYEPFSLCDSQGVALVESYIRKFAARGSAVIVVKSNPEYMESLTDQMYFL